MMEIRLPVAGLLYDIGGLAYVVGDIRDGTLPAHVLHQVFDICQEGNIDRVDRLLSLSFWEAATHIGHVAVALPPEGVGQNRVYRLALKKPVAPAWVMRLKTALREYMTACVLADWLSFTLPDAAPPWREKARISLASLQAAARCSASSCAPRPISPI